MRKKTHCSHKTLAINMWRGPVGGATKEGEWGGKTSALPDLFRWRSKGRRDFKKKGGRGSWFASLPTLIWRSVLRDLGDSPVGSFKERRGGRNRSGPRIRPQQDQRSQIGGREGRGGWKGEFPEASGDLQIQFQLKESGGERWVKTISPKPLPRRWFDPVRRAVKPEKEPSGPQDRRQGGPNPETSIGKISNVR